MFANRKLTGLALRRQELLVQSEVNRRQLTATCGELREAAAGIEAGFDFYQKVRPLATLLEPLVAFFASHFFQRSEERPGKMERAVRLFKAVLSVWKDR